MARIGGLKQQKGGNNGRSNGDVKFDIVCGCGYHVPGYPAYQSQDRDNQPFVEENP